MQSLAAVAQGTTDACRLLDRIADWTRAAREATDTIKGQNPARIIAALAAHPVLHTAQVEELIEELRSQFSVVIVTHSMQQAARVSQKTAFFHLGNLVEYGDTDDIFTRPRDSRTEAYISGRIG